MKAKFLLVVLLGVAMASYSTAATRFHFGKVNATGITAPASQDTIYIPGDQLNGTTNNGLLEATINGDTTSSGARVNPNRVYALYEGEIYYQFAILQVTDPTGTLSIVGVPNPKDPSATEKPMILMVPTSNVDLNANLVYGSVNIDNVYWSAMQLDGYRNWDLFQLGTGNNLSQRLTINNCVFEFCYGSLFTMNTSYIGGWPYGGSIFIKNSYFRNLMDASQWWSSRVISDKNPIDTLWVENSTFTTGGLLFLQQNELTDFTYINHNTIVNNRKYWMLSPYKHDEYIANNIFINQNWVGEDTNVTNSGQDPDKAYMSTINIDSLNTPWQLQHNGLVVNSQYMINGDTTNVSSALALNKLKIFVADNINYYSPSLISGYYNSSTYELATNPRTGAAFNALPSYLKWAGDTLTPFPIHNVPGMWMNSRTQALFQAYSPANGGGFVEWHDSTEDPNTKTPGIVDPSVTVPDMAGWNQNQWGDPRFSTAPNITNSPYIYGDYTATTVPGLVNGVPSDTITQTDPGVQVGISNFWDFTENFSQTSHMSDIDGYPIGSLIWSKTAMANYNSSMAFQDVMNKYQGLTPVLARPTVASTFALSQNYPNPFNPTTQIAYSVPTKGANVSLAVYNVLGERVATLVNGHQSGGEHYATFNGARLASGVYFYRLQSGNVTITKKMMMIK